MALMGRFRGGQAKISILGASLFGTISGSVEATESSERFDEMLEILDAWLAQSVISHSGRHWKFANLRIVPRPLQQPSPPKWTTVVSPASAIKSAGRRSKISTAFQSVGRIKEIFDAYRNEADRIGFRCEPEHLALRRNISIARSEAEAREASQRAMDVTQALLSEDPRVAKQAPSLLDAPKHGSGFSVHADEFIAGTPTQVAEQIVEQCRTCGAGHILAILGRAVDRRRAEASTLFGEEVIPLLRRAQIA